MKIFYIPDGHRRYADRVGCSLETAYRIGYDVLTNEIVRPLCQRPDVTHLGIFLLSDLNMERRHSEDLRALLDLGESLLASLIDFAKPLASIRTLGSYLKENRYLPSEADCELFLIIGSRAHDTLGCPEVDLFLRSGGQLRLSGAPRELIGDYTEMMKLDVEHPELRYADIEKCLAAYENRYMRETGSR